MDDKRLNFVQYYAAPSPGYPPFKFDRSRFDQSTFYGRWRHFLDIIDPVTLFTPEKKLQESIKLLKDFERGNIQSYITDQQLWEAKKIKDAIIHPDTGEKVFMPFRMSGYVPFGTPILIGLLIRNPSTLQAIFWQWINQSHNACVNYSNRNASKPTPTERFVFGYVGAVTCAVGIAVGLMKAIPYIKFLSEPTKQLIQRFVPFPAVATASTCNLVLMRNSELSTGIEVFSPDRGVVGVSCVAAKKALFETGISRVVLATPLLLLPPIVMRQFEKTRLLKKYPRLHLPINSVVCTVAFAVTLPIAIGLFPQVSSIKTSRLEKSIKENTSDHLVYYNKGL